MQLDEPRVKQGLIEMWRSGGMETLVKVMPADQAPDSSRFIGYCTQFKYIVGRTPLEMEAAVGLRCNTKLASGAAVYILRPLPHASQIILRGYSQTPAGVSTSIKPAHPDYPPGLGVPQWEITATQGQLQLLARVTPGERFRFMASQLGPAT